MKLNRNKITFIVYLLFGIYGSVFAGGFDNKDHRYSLREYRKFISTQSLRSLCNVNLTNLTGLGNSKVIMLGATSKVASSAGDVFVLTAMSAAPTGCKNRGKESG